MSIKCRIWWPRQFSSSEPPTSSSSSLLLFGWFVSSSSTSVDIVVAFAHDEASLSQYRQSAVEEGIQHANQRMPLSLRDKSAFSVVGHCVENFGGTNKIVDCDERKLFIHKKVCPQNMQSTYRENCRQLSCECLEFDGLQQQYWKRLLQNTSWILVVYDHHRYSDKETCWIPKLHQMHWKGKIVSQFDLHVIIYDIPSFGGHHFSISLCSLKHLKHSSKRPKWLVELDQENSSLDLDTVIMAINSTAAARMIFRRCPGLERSCTQLPIIFGFLNFIWQFFAALIASFSTLIYVALQFFHKLKTYGSKFWFCGALVKVFGNTCKNIHIRCCQFQYWAVFLNETGLRSQPCVEYAEKAAIKRHSMWSSVAVDIILGNLAGLLLLSHTESVCKLVTGLASHIIDDVLRSGSVWLMGVPAGFKLNTELARVLGMISLNAIQIWSTLWFFTAHIFYYVVKGIALSGILFGMTIAAALVMDMVAIVALHVSTLHWLFSLLYSHLIQALTALWRLFRGRKWNPLRHRLDSYDYTVEQHIVGSLLFAPLLLLLPTISVFYIFFTIMNTATVFLLLLMEVIISVIHATPYNKIFLWLVRSRRFPSGIWFEIICCQNASVSSSTVGFISQVGQTSENMLQDRNATENISALVSFLHSNVLTFGQIVLPEYRNIYSGVYKSTIASSVYSILTGKRIPTMLGCGLPSTIPWMLIPYKEYWESRSVCPAYRLGHVLL
ncbi:hypothetical protein Nepgr_009981 [Nepenthes gracilis]|uniref:Uncharacterized protein n=1 Tax=Nepenthes gracilis TaxID=150966 RepID=A0AAD3SC43_NEPGR|nr:hypothetical protein Nepgr_009981 [Nepenthes gracilis]